jgi:predicted O-methyltransferase YrrM
MLILPQWDIRGYLGITKEEWDVPLVPVQVGMTDGSSLEILLKVARWQKPNHILEIGTNEGKTAAALAKHCPQSTVHTFDIQAYGSLLEDPPNVVRHLYDSRDPRAYRLTPKFDFVFIDGSHKCESVVADSINALYQTNAGAIVFWHDIHDGEPGVIRAVKFMSQIGYIIYHLKGSWLSFLRIPR